VDVNDAKATDPDLEALAEYVLPRLRPLDRRVWGRIVWRGMTTPNSRFHLAMSKRGPMGAASSVIADLWGASSFLAAAATLAQLIPSRIVAGAIGATGFAWCLACFSLFVSRRIQAARYTRAWRSRQGSNDG
jgi:hypothetical protein